MGNYLWGDEEEQNHRDDEGRIHLPLRTKTSFNFSTSEKLTRTHDIENKGVLPMLVIHNIYLHLEPKELLRTALTCKYFYYLFNWESFWKDYTRNFIPPHETSRDHDFSAKEMFYLYHYSCPFKELEDYYKNFFHQSQLSDIHVNYTTLKIVIVGTGGVGKTSLMHSFSERRYYKPYPSTIGIDFKIVKGNFEENNSTQYKLQIWDTAGQERFRSLTRSYYRNCSGCILCFDISSVESFKHMDVFYEDCISALRSTLTSKEEFEKKKPVFIVCGLKCDLEEERQVSRTMVARYLEKCEYLSMRD